MPKPPRKPPVHVGSKLDDGPSPYWSLPQTAAAIHVSTKTLQRFIRAGLFVPHARLGRAFVFRKEKIDAWLSERESATGIVPHVRTRRASTTPKRKVSARKAKGRAKA